MTAASLPAAYTVRHPTLDDFDAVFDLTTRLSLHLHGAPDFSREELRIDWESANFHLGTDVWVVMALDGRLVGYADVGFVYDVRVGIGVRVDPAHQGRGIGTYLLALTERRAQDFMAAAPAGVEVRARQWISTADAAAHTLLSSAGYAVERRFWRMKIELRERPPAPQWPAGTTFHTLGEGLDERAIHAATEEAFADHWGHAPASFEQWAHREILRGDFDPTLWLVALDGGEIAGVAHARMNGDMGFIDELSVRRPWRGQGLGMALLRWIFATFYERGVTTVGLGVDSQNETRAAQLYERAGMHVYQAWDIYEKVLRPGQPVHVTPANPT